MTEIVLLSGGSSPAGHAVARLLLGRGVPVCIASRTARAPEGITTDEASLLTLLDADLTNVTQVERVRTALADAGYRVHHLVHLVGGWAGGSGITGQNDDSYAALHVSLTSLRTVTRAFFDDLVAGPAPRVVTVSSPLAQSPTASSANYAAVKAASEAWTLALHAGLTAKQSAGAASIIVTDSLAGREASFARLVADVLDSPAKRIGGARILHV